MVAGTGRMLDYFIGIDITERKPNIPKAKKAPKGSRPSVDLPSNLYLVLVGTLNGPLNH